MASGEEDGTVEEKETNNKKRTKGAIATAWLTFYNIAMTAGYLWLVLAVAMVRYYLQKGTHKGLYRNIARTLKFFQTFALLEISRYYFWCAKGIVRTSVIVTGVQVCSRIFMVWFVTNSIRQVSESVILFVVVWTITEITRYSFYTFNLLNHLPYFIKWARYKSELHGLVSLVYSAWCGFNMSYFFAVHFSTKSISTSAAHLKMQHIPAIFHQYNSPLSHTAINHYQYCNIVI
uniref:Very-long-chain (3R)-3-hydroxyacyl-CoA dehydratase n=1 Tax=Cyprinus carpio TaxID=7962 RepID=A0A8C2Q2H5_CYPCA